jgi:hypothetical protein
MTRPTELPNYVLIQGMGQVGRSVHIRPAEVIWQIIFANVRIGERRMERTVHAMARKDLNRDM